MLTSRIQVSEGLAFGGVGCCCCIDYFHFIFQRKLLRQGKNYYCGVCRFLTFPLQSSILSHADGDVVHGLLLQMMSKVQHHQQVALV